MVKKILFFSAISIYLSKSIAQIAPGAWTDHISYHAAEKVVVGGSKIFVCTSNSLFYYEPNVETRGITKVQGLSEVEIATIEFVPSKEMLIIAYTNSSIDILDKKNKITNLPYIKNKLTISDRRINDIMVIENDAYLSCNFGIVVLDLDKLEVKDTYYPGFGGSVNRVNHLCTDGQNTIFAATQTGIFKAAINDLYLVDYSRWEHLSGFLGNNLECKSIAYLAGNLFAAYSNPSDLAKDSLIYFDGNSWKMTPHFGNGSSINSINVSGSKLYCSTGWGEFTVDEKLNFNVLLSSEYTPYPTYATSDKEGNTWISDKVKTLIKITPKGISSEIKPPDSPFYPDVVRIDIFDGRVWTAAGSKNELWGGMYNHNDAQGYFNGSWHWYNAESTKELLNVRDIINVKICPSNTDKVYLASWTNGGGLIEINNGEFKFYNNENSSLQFSTIFGACQINGLSFDNSGNLWVTNSNIKKQLSVLTQKGVWKNFSLGNTAIANGNIGDVLVTSWGHKWVVLGKSTNLVVFDSGNDPLSESDDRKVDISLSNVQSIIQPLNIYCIAEDHQGSIWIGTDAGPVRFDSPQNAFDDGGTSGAKIKVPIANGKTDAAYLLETERINAIAIDGADRKWFGTQNSGVYLMSDDGLKQISHFTSENSPLFSNSINDIKIDPKSGEVYFATDKGLISYRGYAKQGGDEFGKVYVYPNPIRENYTSDIFITGLIENTIVKITDISGNLVFETKSLGGQAVWDGKNLLGKRVNTGVYLVFCSNKDGSKTAVAKLLFIH